MKKFKAYPTDEMNEPHERIETVNGGGMRAMYSSSAAVILTHAEYGAITCFLQSMAETIGDEENEDMDLISGILATGADRMNGLHDFLGAYDVDGNGAASKPLSERTGVRVSPRPKKGRVSVGR